MEINGFLGILNGMLEMLFPIHDGDTTVHSFTGRLHTTATCL